MHVFEKDEVQKDVDEFVGCFGYYKGKTKPEFGIYSPTYTFTNENLIYLNEFDVKGESVLTVASSFDQALNLAYKKARTIDCFDISKSSFYFSKLKLAALLTLSYEDFLLFLTGAEESIMMNNTVIPVNPNEHCFDYNIYMKVRVLLDDDAKYFFDTLYLIFNYDNIALKKSGLFYNISKDIALYNNMYLKTSKNYYKTRESILLILRRGIHFFNMDVFKLSDVNQTYALILLSNIFDYIGEDKDRYIEFITNKLSRLLCKSGSIVMRYQYGFGRRIGNDAENRVMKSKIDSKHSENATINDYSNISCFDVSEIHNIPHSYEEVYEVPTVYSSPRSQGVTDGVYVLTKTKR